MKKVISFFILCFMSAEYIHSDWKDYIAPSAVAATTAGVAYWGWKSWFNKCQIELEKAKAEIIRLRALPGQIKVARAKNQELKIKLEKMTKLRDQFYREYNKLNNKEKSVTSQKEKEKLLETIKYLYKKLYQVGIVINTDEGLAILRNGLQLREGVEFPNVDIINVWRDNKERLDTLFLIHSAQYPSIQSAKEPLAISDEERKMPLLQKVSLIDSEEGEIR